MSEQARLCQPCKDRGRVSVAHRIVDRTPMCDGCFSGRPASGVPAGLANILLVQKKQEASGMRKQTDEAVQSAIRRDAAAGMSLGEIAAKHKVSWPTAKRYAGVTDGKKHAARPKSAAKSSNASPTLAATPELCDRIWNALPLEKKAALLNRLHELN